MPVVDAASDLFARLIHPLQWLIAWVMVRFHDLLTTVGLDPAGGAAWALSVVGLVVVVRLALTPLFVAQVRGMRGLQALQPELRTLQARYAGRTDPASRQALQQERLALVRNSGANPVAGCLPVLLQAPVLLALFTTLEGVRRLDAVGPLSDALVRQADAATIFGAPLSGSLWGSEHLPTIAVAAVMVLLTSVAQLLTQRLVMAKNTAVAPAEGGGALARQQRVLLVALPVLVAVPGLHLPLGVLLYWLTSTLWSMGQQALALRLMPSPGSLAERELAQRRARRATRRGEVPVLPPGPEKEASPTTRPGGRRRQPRGGRQR